MLYPLIVIQGIFVLDGLDNDLAVAVQGQLGHHTSLVTQQGVEVGNALGSHAINGSDDITLLDIHARLQQRRTQRLAVGSATQDFLDFVAISHFLHFSAEHTDVVLIGLDMVTTIDIGVAHGQLTNHTTDDIGQVETVLDIG